MNYLVAYIYYFVKTWASQLTQSAFPIVLSIPNFTLEKTYTSYKVALGFYYLGTPYHA